MKFEVQTLHKSFGEKKVLEGVSFTASSGRALGLLGRNGAGKTTSIRIIMNVFPPDSGTVLLDGQPIHRENLNIGYLPEEHGLYPKKKVDEQLLYLAKLRGMKTADAKKSMVYWLGRLGMVEYTSRKLDTLSKGNQQKIQLVAALITNPDFVILDEPFSGLDPVNAALLKDIVKELIANGKIVLFSSHQMSYVEEFCDDIAILHHGKIVLSGAISDIKRSYDRRAVFVKTDTPQPLERFCAEKLPQLVQSCQAQKNGAVLHLHQEEQWHAFLQALSSSDLSFDSAGVFEPSLNDIFIQYTGDAAEHQNGGTAE